MELRVVGKPLPRKDAVEKLTGRAVFGADLNLPGQLHGAVVRAALPHARILSVDTEKALAFPGVRAVATAKELGNALFGQFIVDQPVLAFDRVRYRGEPVALVAADDPHAAAEAARLVEVVLEPLPVVADIDAALRGETLLHDWDDYAIAGACSPVRGTNIGDVFTLRHGDVDAGFAGSDVVVEDVFECAMVQHAVIETHAAVARADRATGEVVVHSPTQSPFMLRGVLAAAFGLPLAKVRVVQTCLGGAFGCKYEAKAEPLAIALALFCGGRPVKLAFSRAEEFEATVARAPVRIWLKTGARRDGTLVARHAVVHWDTGAYVTTGPRVNYNAGFAACGPYRLPHARVDGYCLMTNKSLGTAYRGFGVPEVAAAHERQMDVLADRLGIDPLDLRLKNILRDGDVSITGETMVSVAAEECLRTAAGNVGWRDRPLRWTGRDGKLYGKGIATFIKLTGTPSTTSIVIKMNEDGSFAMLLSIGEMGQGVLTALPQIAAECMGVDPGRISVSTGDTAYTPYDKTTTSSRSTFHGGNAVILACRDMQRQLLALAAERFKVGEEEMEYVDGNIRVRGDDARRIHIDDVAASGLLKERPPVIGRGSYGTSGIFDPPDPATRQSTRPTVMWMFGAQAAVVEVDPDTGKAKLVELGAAHDVGRAVNSLGCVQQIEGAVVMGLGHALTEEMIYRDGELLNGNLVDYKVPTFEDIDAEVKIVLVEKPHPEGPFGAKGIGEPAVCPTAAAIAGAVGAACGGAFGKLPVKPEDVLERLADPENRRGEG